MYKNSLIPYTLEDAPKINLETQLTVTDESFFISYKLTGDIDKIDLGDGHPKRERLIGLWNKTCFELFIKNEKNQYIEFNFSPTFEWNSFFFNKKGDDLKEYQEISSLKTDILLSYDVFLLVVEIKKQTLPQEFLTENKMSAGITSVIKTKESSLSYWALSHEDTRPNFHHFDSFKCKF